MSIMCSAFILYTGSFFIKGNLFLFFFSAYINVDKSHGTITSLLISFDFIILAIFLLIFLFSLRRFFQTKLIDLRSWLSNYVTSGGKFYCILTLLQRIIAFIEKTLPTNSHINTNHQPERLSISTPPSSPTGVQLISFQKELIELSSTNRNYIKSNKRFIFEPQKLGFNTSKTFSPKKFSPNETKVISPFRKIGSLNLSGDVEPSSPINDDIQEFNHYINKHRLSPEAKKGRFSISRSFTASPSVSSPNLKDK